MLVLVLTLGQLHLVKHRNMKLSDVANIVKADIWTEQGEGPGKQYVLSGKKRT